MTPKPSHELESVWHSERTDGRFVTIEGFLHARLKHLEPQLALPPDMSAALLKDWRNRVRNKLRELLAFPAACSRLKNAPRMLEAEERAGYTLQKWEAYPEPFSVVPFLLLIPDGVTSAEPGAAVMCFPGSNGTKELLAGEPDVVDWAVSNKHPERNKMAQHYARAGLVAVAVDHPDRGEHTSNIFSGSRYEIGVHALWLGRSFEGISVFQKWTIYQWLKTQPFIDPQKIAVSGHSLGAKPALHLGVLEPDIAAVVWNDFCANWRTRELVVANFRAHFGHYIPGMQQWFDYTDLMAALAPRPFLITEGGRTEDIARVRRAWEACDAAQNMAVHYYPKYAAPEQRPHDGDPLYEGMDMDSYFEYANVDAPQHCFKENVAVDWLTKVLQAAGTAS